MKIVGEGRRNILVIGGGGREHAIVWKLRQSRRLGQLYCSPGNAGISRDATTFSADWGENFSKLIERIRALDIDYTVVGPEVPLADGIADALESAGCKVFGPKREAARLESSKAFAKEIMLEAGIPTAASKTFDNSDAAIRYAEKLGTPVVIKADGLAAGKGVVVAATLAEARQAIHDNLDEKQFGEASQLVVVEEFLRGEEVSVLAFCDGNTIVPMSSAQDHKRLLDGDVGPNTGGMGTYSPAPVATDELMQEVRERVFEPLQETLQRRHIPFRGVLFVGIMATESGVKVLEFNCRFGDPETQVLLPRLENDFVSIVEAVCEGTLHQHALEWNPDTAVCVVLAAKGYPDSPRKGDPIHNWEDVHDGHRTYLFHSGTAWEGRQLITAGGRVLGVVSMGSSLPRALHNVYQTVEQIKFPGMQYRTDIGQKAFLHGDGLIR